MSYLIGTDEAGYGPNLGPLVISATVWEVPDGLRGDQLYERLGDVVTASVEQAVRDPARRVAMADSKVLYPSGKGLRHLERGLWAAWAVLGHAPRSWRGVWDLLAPTSADDLLSVPWHADYERPLPMDLDPAELAPLGAALRDGLAAAGVRLVGLRSRAVFPAEFNRLVLCHGSKGTALSHLTLELASRVMEPLDQGPIAVWCDKHGGRDRYAALLGRQFPDCFVEVHGEGRQQSVYWLGPAERRVEFRFLTKAEAHLPVALASMASKYLRELAMKALNDFWCARVERLRPTAGYPQDAKRYKAAVARVQAELEIDDDLLWRVK